MVFGKGDSAKDTDVPSLINRKQYARAIEVLKGQLRSSKSDDRARLQLADVLVLAKKSHEAVSILTSLADEYARDGFAAKAISVLKRIERIDPGRRDVGAKIASLIAEKQRQATIPAASSSLEIGMEEIGFDSADVGSVSVPADLSESAPEPPVEEPVVEPSPEVPFALSEDGGLELEAEPVLEAPRVILEAPREEEAPTEVQPPPVVDMDLLTAEDAVPEEVPEIVLEPSLVSEPEFVEPEVEPEASMSEADFGDELLALVDEAFLPGGSGTEPEAPTESGRQIVVSPLFKDFSVDELVAVIQGLTLLSFEPGDVVISEGEPGDSLYMVTSGSVKVLRKNAQGKVMRLGILAEGAFFGEGSILTGRPRAASVVATTRCEMLELDRPTLDGIVETHPRVREILEEFARERTRGRAPTS